MVHDLANAVAFKVRGPYIYIYSKKLGKLGTPSALLYS